jgi:8-oxo-dGTP pyrophosphatase MutT (NUDIX family)
VNKAVLAQKIQRCVAAVVFRHGKVLVIRHKTRGTVDLPGGKKETETEVEALCRELYEECGLTRVQVVRWLFCDEGRGKDGRQYVVQVYLCSVPEDQEPVAGDDASEAWWAEPEELLAGSFPQDYPHVKRLLDPAWKP